jgi:hypothetical protein
MRPMVAAMAEGSCMRLIVAVMAGLDPAIYRGRGAWTDARVDPRVKSGDGHDRGEDVRLHPGPYPDAYGADPRVKPGDGHDGGERGFHR